MAIELTDLTEDEFKEYKKTDACPKCKSNNTTTGTFQYDEEPYMPVNCNVCGAIWHEVYKIANVTMIA